MECFLIDDTQVIAIIVVLFWLCFGRFNVWSDLLSRSTEQFIPPFTYLSLIGIDTSPALSQFLIPSWRGHFFFTLAFVIVVHLVKSHYSEGSATRTDFLVNLIYLPMCWAHTIIVLIISLKRFARKYTGPTLIYLYISSYPVFGATTCS